MSDDEALAVAQFEELLRRSPHVRKVIAKACRESFLEGQQAGERKAASVLDAIKSVSRLNGSGAVAIEVGERVHDPAAREAILGDLLKAKKREDEPDRDLALVEAMFRYAEECAASGSDSSAGLELLREMFEDSEVYKAGKWDSEKHPRDDKGRFISKDAIAEAKTNPDKAKELLDRTTRPEERAKLEAAIGGDVDLGRTKRGEQKQRAAKNRIDKEEAKKQTNALISKFSDANAKPGEFELRGADFEAMAAHLPTMTVAELRRARMAMRASFGGGKKKADLVASLVKYARENAPAKMKEAKQPRAASKSDSIYNIVKQHGGIDPDDPALGTFSEARQDGISLGIFKRGGWGLDELAQELHITGDIRVPEGETPGDYLFDLLKKKARSRHANLEKEYEKAEKEYWRMYAEAETEHDATEIEEAVRSGEEAGISEASDADVADDGGRGDASEEGLEDADTSFDFLKAHQFDENKVKRDSGKFSKQDKVKGGKADDKPDQDFDRGELKQGQQVEKEHTDDPAVAKEIAKYHLAESPDYYDKLEQVEGGDEVKVAADADQKLGQFLARADEVPPTVRQRVKAFAQKRYDGLVAKYGKTGAAAVLAATVLLLPVPIPGTSLVPIAIAEAISRLVRSGSNDQ